MVQLLLHHSMRMEINAGLSLLLSDLLNFDVVQVKLQDSHEMHTSGDRPRGE